ncbi:MAG: tRNA (adenosine(37)-N6)-threonylcarbamoyltransferase complex dimerization subunit type 1 TsaB [Phycisphaerales bacterium]|nr:tRNA (adenosine(37)-N6)-threonylcarbamoyltransferase complex dimerization subunit type 1 TsaB [Phycisphaerales bacterium]
MPQTKDSSQPPFLAIEMSQRLGSIALSSSGIVDSIEFECGGRQDDLLLPSIDELLSRHGVRPAALGGIAVSIGPGGFTGLRIAVATAKGIAEVTGCSLHAVPSGHVASESITPRPDSGVRVVVLSAAKQGTCWITSLECEPDCWRELPGTGIRPVDPPTDEVISMCRGAIVLMDEHVPEGFRNAVEGIASSVLTPTHRADACLRLGVHMAGCGDAIDPLELLPLYPREPEAVRIWRTRD